MATNDRTPKAHTSGVLEIRAGRELNELPREDQRIIGRDIAKVQFGWPIELPVCRPLGNGLWEVRSSLPSHREGRLLFGFHDEALIALAAFIKKTQATPDRS